MAYSPKKVVQTANLTDFTIKIYLFLLKIAIILGRWLTNKTILSEKLPVNFVWGYTGRKIKKLKN